jgi:hypothetical protein
LPYSIIVLGIAQAELEAIWGVDEDAAADIEEWLYRFDGDQDLLDTLTVHDYGAYRLKPYHVSKWLELWNEGHDIWRLKIWGPSEAYRTVYAYQRGKQRYTVLGIPARNFDYSVEHPTSQRMLDDYANL